MELQGNLMGIKIFEIFVYIRCGELKKSFT